MACINKLQSCLEQDVWYTAKRASEVIGYSESHTRKQLKLLYENKFFKRDRKDLQGGDRRDWYLRCQWDLNF